MRGNSFGKMLSITSFGESHGRALGVVIDGLPPGLDFDLEELANWLARRAPGGLKGGTARKESDLPQVLSGVFEGKTLGTPIAVMVENTNQRSGDYDKLKDDYRPGHADKTTMEKYGIRDHRGGGRSSGRETLARVIGGYAASLVVPKILVKGFITKLGPFVVEDEKVQFELDRGPYSLAAPGKDQEIEDYLLDLKSKGESIGGQVVILVKDCPVGLGEPAFDKLKADLAKALLSIGAVVSFSYGLGEKMAELLGQEVSVNRSSFGGIEGGISNGEMISMKVTFKPTSTVGEKATSGRHDPCIIPRAIPVLESMVYLTLADHFLRQKAYESWLKKS